MDHHLQTSSDPFSLLPTDEQKTTDLHRRPPPASTAAALGRSIYTVAVSSTALVANHGSIETLGCSFVRSKILDGRRLKTETRGFLRSISALVANQRLPSMVGDGGSTVGGGG
ncbi:hypothetical protein R6Q59_003639 [Mikania micrantha]